MGSFFKGLVNSEVWHLYEPFIVSLVLGGLVGIEREFKKQKENKPFFGGIRTFILISLFGTVAGEISRSFGLPVVYVSLFSLSLLIVGALFLEKAPGLTSEISALITFFIGVLCSEKEYQLASLISVSLLFVLSFKEQMHSFVKHLTLQDLYAFLKFAAVTVIVYPLLPSTNVYGVNLREVWTMVVVISGIDFLGYVLTKVAGEKGVVITGFIGGLVSSTAVTATFSPLSKVNPTLLREYAAGIVGASSIMFLRMAVLAALVDLRFAEHLLVPSAVAFLFGMAYSYWLSVKKTSKRANVNVTNPFELSTAIKFGVFYAFVLFLSRNAVEYFGNYGLYAVAAISGLSDVDAITLSTTKLFGSNLVELIPGIFTVLLAAFVNTLFKWFLTFSMGTAELFKLTTPGFLALAVGEVFGFLVFIFH